MLLYYLLRQECDTMAIDVTHQNKVRRSCIMEIHPYLL